MKARHAAALALVGWYLMVPLRPGDPSEPLSHWYQSPETFNTEDDCKELLEYDVSRFYGKQLHDPAIREHVRSLQYARCVADNDPRFKSK
jgi:hypothetical protein